MPKKIQRINLGETSAKTPIELFDLTEIQKSSFEQFLKEGIAEVISEISPITDYTGKNFSLELAKPLLGTPKYKPYEALEKGQSYEAPLFAHGKLTNLETKEEVEQDVYLGEIPQMTERGTFIINGNERIVVTQLSRAPGVYFEEQASPVLGRKFYTASLRPERGSWVLFETGKDDVLWVRIQRTGRKIAATVLLKAFGITHEELPSLFASVETDASHPFLSSTLKKDPTKDKNEALLEIYSKMRPGDPKILENAKDFFEATFLDPRRFSLGKVGRFKINKRLGLNFAVTRENFLLKREDLIALLSELIRLNLTQEPGDDIDHLSNRRVRRVGELVGQSFRTGLLWLERSVKERLSVASEQKKLTPNALVNARPVVASLNRFFGSSQLSQFMDQTNPLSEIEHLRRITALGPGGLTRERAGVAVRDVQPSHYGRLGAIKTPEGPNIGLNLSLGIFAQADEFGLLQTPYREVEHKKDGSYITDKIVFLPADDEENYFIAESTISTDKDGKILEDPASARYKGDFLLAPAEKIDFVDVSSNQMLGISSSLIPFISSDVGSRALMGANMQCQAVPLICPQTCIVGTGLESRAAFDSGRVLLAKNAGTVLYVDASRIEIETKNGKEKYSLTKFSRTNVDTCYNQIPRVSVGDKVKKGQVLADGPASEAGELALGRDLLCAFMPYAGFNYEDSIVISERVLKEDLLTSIHIREYEASLMDTKLGPEEVTRDIPNVSEEALRNLDEEGTVVIGAEVGSGDILVGKIAPKGETELTAEERLLRAIFGEKAREVRDTSLYMPHGERGKVIAIKILDKAKGDELGPGVLKSVKVLVAQKRKIQVGDKISGRHGSKGVVAKIFAEEDMPFLEDGTPVDIILNPISILQRMNIGQILETHLGWAGKKLGEHFAIPAYDKLIGGILEKKLKEAGLPNSGKVTLFDGNSGKPFGNPVTVGCAYIMKLHHLVEDKVHARSTGPYSLVTQQPLGGKAQMGGQRFGEMEVWALQAYGAAFNLLEMLTIKSDDVVGRAKAFESIVKGVPIPEARIPEAFKLLVKELNSLCLGVDTVSLEKEGGISAAEIIEKESAREIEAPKKEAKELAEVSGQKTVTRERELKEAGMGVEER